MKAKGLPGVTQKAPRSFRMAEKTKDQVLVQKNRQTLKKFELPAVAGMLCLVGKNTALN